MWELDRKEGWAPKNWCFWTEVLEKSLESPLDCMEIKPINPKGNQSWIFIGKTDAEAEGLILWLPDVKNWHIGKDPDAGKVWRQEEKVRQKTRWLDGITDSMDVSLSNFWEIVKGREHWHAAVHGVTNSQTWLSDWATAIITKNSSDVACKEKYVKVYLYWLFSQNEFSKLLLYKLNITPYSRLKLLFIYWEIQQITMCV